jgi:hypothetical protein
MKHTNLLNWKKLTLCMGIAGLALVTSCEKTQDAEYCEPDCECQDCYTPDPPGTKVDTLRFNINSVAQFMDYMPRMNDSAAVPYRYIIANVGSLGFASEDQLSPLANAAYTFRNRQNTELNWTDWHPTAPGIMIEYANHFRKAGSPMLRAAPYKWIASETDFPKFVAAGQAGAIDTIPQDPPVNSCEDLEKEFAQLEYEYLWTASAFRNAILPGLTDPNDIQDIMWESFNTIATNLGISPKNLYDTAVVFNNTLNIILAWIHNSPDLLPNQMNLVHLNTQAIQYITRHGLLQAIRQELYECRGGLRR